jgi:hypothetical protein
MIKHLSANQIDHNKWDECINKSFNGNVYALSWYLNIMHPEWEALVEDNYKRVMPLTVSKKYGLNYMMQPYFIQQLGIFSKSKLFPKKTEEFISAIPKKIKYVDINLNIHNKIDSKYSQIVNKNHLLDLVSEYEKIKKAYSTNTKRNLKKAEKNNLQLQKNIKPKELIDLFKNNKGKEISNFKEDNYKNLERLMFMSIHKGLGELYGVYDSNNQLCAGAFFSRYKKRLIFLFSGSNKIAKENAAMFFLIDSIIKKYSPSEFTLDFEGSNDKNLARFYKGFGSKEVFYNRLKINNLIFPLNNLLNYYLSKK